MDDPDGEQVVFSWCLGSHTTCEIEGEYIDLIDNPEKFTGYSGPSAHRIWGAIYNENCFGISELNLLSHSNPEPVSPLDSGPFQEKVAEESEEAVQCLEKRAYYKIISGMIFLLAMIIFLISINLRPTYFYFYSPLP